MTTHEKLRMAFDMFDTDNDNKVSVNDLFSNTNMHPAVHSSVNDVLVKMYNAKIKDEMSKKFSVNLFSNVRFSQLT